MKSMLYSNTPPTLWIIFKGDANIKYEDIPESQTPTLKLKDKEVKTSWYNQKTNIQLKIHKHTAENP